RWFWKSEVVTARPFAAKISNQFWSATFRPASRQTHLESRGQLLSVSAHQPQIHLRPKLKPVLCLTVRSGRSRWLRDTIYRVARFATSSTKSVLHLTVHCAHQLSHGCFV